MLLSRRALPIWFIFSVSLFALYILPSEATTTAPNTIITKALSPSKNTNYTAHQVLILKSNNTYNSIAIKVYYSSPKMVKMEYLDPNGYPYKVILDNGKENWYYEITHRRAFKTESTYKAVAKLTPKVLGLLQKNFTIKLSKTSKLCNRPVYLIEIRSKRDHKLVKMLWIDKVYYTILKSEEYKDGYPINISYYTSIEYKKQLDKKIFTLTIPDDVLTTYTTSGKDVFSLANLRKNCKFNVNIPNHLPDGYAFTSANIGSNAVCLRFSNGLNTISLYEALGNYKHHLTKVHNKKYSLVHGFNAQLLNFSQNTILMWETPRAKYTLIGDLSKQEAINIANSLPYPKQEIRLPFWKIVGKKTIYFITKVSQMIIN